MKLLEDLAPARVIEAIEANRFAAFSTFGRTPHGELHEDESAIRLVTPIRELSPMSSAVFRARFPEEHAERAVTATLAFFQERHLPLLWNTGPATRPPDLGKVLQAKGLVRLFVMPGMAVELEPLQADRDPPQGLEIQTVASAASLKSWGQTFAHGFQLEQAVAEPVAELLAHVGLDIDSGWRHYLGLLDGQPVATTSLYLGAGVAGIYFVSTVPAARRRGIGRALTLAALLDGRELGMQVAILHASPLGKPVYERLGFAEFCSLAIYVPRGADPGGAFRLPEG